LRGLEKYDAASTPELIDRQSLMLPIAQDCMLSVKNGLDTRD
jgi:hypothetical protein